QTCSFPEPSRQVTSVAKWKKLFGTFLIYYEIAPPMLIMKFQEVFMKSSLATLSLASNPKLKSNEQYLPYLMLLLRNICNHDSVLQVLSSLLVGEADSHVIYSNVK